MTRQLVGRPSAISKEEHARVIRDAALSILKEYGKWQSAGSARIFVADIGELKLGYSSAFSLPRKAELPNDLSALAKEAKPNFSHALDIWFQRKKVFSMGWDYDGSISIVSFKRGVWEK